MNKQVKMLLCILTVITSLSVNAFAADYSGSDIAGIESIVEDITTPSDEQWRADANQRIDQHRKANMDIKVLDDQTGLPIPGIEVDVKLTKHKFLFGGIVRAKTLMGVDANISQELYRNTFLNMGFNASGFNNALKQKQQAGQGPYIQPSLDWFKSYQIPVRGHCLIWPGINSSGNNHMTATVSAALDAYNLDPTEANKQYLRELIESEMIDWSSSWDVFEWDVINEERGNHDLMDALGDGAMVDWFNIGQQYSVNPNVKLLLNEFQIVSDMLSETQIVTNKITEYKNTVNFLLANGASITGFGFQSRFGNMPSGDTIYKRLQQFDEYGLPISATEFEMKPNLGTDFNKAIMTERVMTAYFSHHLVSSINAWSIFPNVDNREIVDEFGNPNLRGKVWLYLMKKHWMTDETLEADSAGNASVRGFKGDYDITVRYLGGTKTVQVSLDQDSLFTINIPSGDSDADSVDDVIEGTGDLDYDGTPDYLDPGTFPLSLDQQQIVTNGLLHNTGKDTSDALFRAYVDFDTFNDTTSTTPQVIFEIGGGGGGDGFSLVYAPGDQLILTICGDNASRIDTVYTLYSAQISAGTIELTGIVDVDYPEGNGTEDIIKLFVDRQLVGSAVTTLGDNDFINSDKSGFGMNGGNATGGWQNTEDSVDFTSGMIDYDRGLWYCDDIRGIELGWCHEANIDGINTVDINDFALMASNWLSTDPGIQGDINKDGQVNSKDLIIMGSNWLLDCSK